MTEQRPINPDQLLEQYLDGLLNEDDRQAFEQVLTNRPDLQRQVELQASIDSALRRRFQPTSTAPRVHHNGIATSRPQVIGRVDGRRRAAARSPLRRLALAASILLAVTGGWLIWQAIGPRARGPGYENPWRSMSEQYAMKIQDGMDPDWVCKDEQEFRDAFVQEFNHPLLLGLDRLPAGVEAVGLSYSNTMSRRTINVLARVEGQPVVVFVDRAERDSRTLHEPAEGLHLFRRPLGGLVLYELTPLEYPALLEQFFLPAPGDEDGGGGVG